MNLRPYQTRLIQILSVISSVAAMVVSSVCVALITNACRDFESEMSNPRPLPTLTAFVLSHGDKAPAIGAMVVVLLIIAAFLFARNATTPQQASTSLLFVTAAGWGIAFVILVVLLVALFPLFGEIVKAK